MTRLSSLVTATVGLASLVVAAPRTRGPRVGAREVWHVPGDGHGVPVADGSAVYFLSRFHEVVAVNRSTGRVIWRGRTRGAGGVTQGAALRLSGPTVVAGDGDLIAFDRASGTVRWRYLPPDGYGLGYYLGDATVDTVYAGSAAGRLYAVSSSGRLRWMASLAPDDRATVFEPAISGKDVAATVLGFTDPPTGALVVLDAATGRQRWRATFPDRGDPVARLPGGPVVWADELVVVASRDGAIHAFERSTGSLRWTAPPVADVRTGWPTASNDFRALARADDLIIAGSLGGTVSAYELGSGRPRWRTTPLAASVAFAVAASGDGLDVYVPYLSGELVAIDARDGHERWRVGGAPVGFRWGPAVEGDRVFAAAAGAGFFALER